LNSTKTSKKLVFITSRFPFPIEKGDKLRAYYQLRDLSSDWEIHLISLSDVEVTEEHKMHVASFCASTHVLRISKWLGFLRVFFGLFGQRPFQTYYFKTWRHKRTVNRLLKEIQPDHIFAQLIRTTEYVKNYHACPKTLDYMDILSLGVQRRIELAPKLFRPIYESEWRRLLKYEHIIFDYFENHAIISTQDRDHLMHPDKHKVHVVPNGVDEHFLSYETKGSSKIYDVCFIGNLSYPPNIEAVKFIVNELLPELVRRDEHLKILVSGANPTSEVLSFSDKITITGWVDDIRESYAKSKVFIAPMFIGTGLQNKLLEALALGLPCVTTPLAHKPLNCDEEIVSIAENAEVFADAILKHLADYDNPQKREARKSFVERNFDWKQINKELGDLMRR